MRKFGFAGAAAMVTLLMAAGHASATSFDFSYSFPTGDTFDFPSGQTSASGVIDADLISPGQYLATSISGQWNGETITGLTAPGGEGGNDNLLFPGGSTVLDSNGFTFSVGGPINGDLGLGFVNVFYDPTFGYTDDNQNTGFSPTFNLTPAAAPEPGAWALMLLGLGGAGAALRRRRNAPDLDRDKMALDDPDARDPRAWTAA